MCWWFFCRMEPYSLDGDYSIWGLLFMPELGFSEQQWGKAGSRLLFNILLYSRSPQFLGGGRPMRTSELLHKMKTDRCARSFLLLAGRNRREVARWPLRVYSRFGQWVSSHRRLSVTLVLLRATKSLFSTICLHSGYELRLHVTHLLWENMKYIRLSV